MTSALGTLDNLLSGKRRFDTLSLEVQGTTKVGLFDSQYITFKS